MVAKDTVIGVVGAVVLLAALTGVFYYEGSSAEGSSGGATTYEATWSTEPGEGPSIEGETAEGETTNETVTVERANMTRAGFVLTWTDDTGEPDTFRITVTSPNGQTNSTEGDSGELLVGFPGINGVPPEASVQADSRAEAERKLAAQHTKTLGVGDWSVEIELVEAGDQDPLGAGPPIEEDTGNSWTLSMALEVYVPQISEA